MTEPTGPAGPDRDNTEADTVEAGTAARDTAERDTAERERDADAPGQLSGTRRKAGVEYKPI
jgi:hypothetical protein